MTFVRRYLVLATLMFWQGGFTFYAAVVVHVGSDVLGSHREQGMVTRSVTNYLNLSGVAALVVWSWDLARARDPEASRRRRHWMLRTLLVTALGILAWLHPRLDELIVAGDIVNQSQFNVLHGWYLNISTVQWAGSLLLMAATLRAWRAEDIGQEARSLPGESVTTKA